MNKVYEKYEEKAKALSDAHDAVYAARAELEKIKNTKLKHCCHNCEFFHKDGMCSHWNKKPPLSFLFEGSTCFEQKDFVPF